MSNILGKRDCKLNFNDLPFKEDSPRFTTVPFKPLTNQGWQTFPYLSGEMFVIAEYLVLQAVLYLRNKEVHRVRLRTRRFYDFYTTFKRYIT